MKLIDIIWKWSKYLGNIKSSQFIFVYFPYWKIFQVMLLDGGVSRNFK